MNTIILILRVVHVVAGVSWAGGAILMTGVVGPAFVAAGDPGQKFRQHISLKSNFSMFMGIAATLTFLSGAVILAILWNLTSGQYASTGSGLTLTIGAGLGTLAWLHGYFSQGRTTQKMRDLAEKMEATAGPPKPEQIQAMQAMGKSIGRSSAIGTIIIVITIILMAAAEYV